MNKSVYLKWLIRLVIAAVLFFGLGIGSNVLTFYCWDWLPYVMWVMLLVKIIGVILIVSKGEFRKSIWFVPVYLGLLLIVGTKMIGFFDLTHSESLNYFWLYESWKISFVGHLIILLAYVIYLIAQKRIKEVINLKALFVILEGYGVLMGYYLMCGWVNTSQYNWVQLLSAAVMIAMLLRSLRRKRSEKEYDI